METYDLGFVIGRCNMKYSFRHVCLNWDLVFFRIYMGRFNQYFLYEQKNNFHVVFKKHLHLFDWKSCEFVCYMLGVNVDFDWSIVDKFSHEQIMNCLVCVIYKNGKYMYEMANKYCSVVQNGDCTIKFVENMICNGKINDVWDFFDDEIRLNYIRKITFNELLLFIRRKIKENFYTYDCLLFLNKFYFNKKKDWKSCYKDIWMIDGNDSLKFIFNNCNFDNDDLEGLKEIFWQCYNNNCFENMKLIFRKVFCKKVKERVGHKVKKDDEKKKDKFLESYKYLIDSKKKLDFVNYDCRFVKILPVVLYSFYCTKHDENVSFVNYNVYFSNKEKQKFGDKRDLMHDVLKFVDEYLVGMMGVGDEYYIDMLIVKELFILDMLFVMKFINRIVMAEIMGVHFVNLAKIKYKLNCFKLVWDYVKRWDIVNNIDFSGCLGIAFDCDNMEFAERLTDLLKI